MPSFGIIRTGIATICRANAFKFNLLGIFGNSFNTKPSRDVFARHEAI